MQIYLRHEGKRSNNTVNPDYDMILIEGCKSKNRESQRMLYKHYYGYAMSICVRYAQDHEEAREILNDAFMKVFAKIDMYDSKRSFKGWLRRIMINTAIDHFRANKKHYYHADITEGHDQQVSVDVIDDMSHNDILELVQRLSPMYRTVFSLYVIDGYNHEEIAKQLGISVGTSKSNLSKARANLRKMLMKMNKEIYEQYI
ncbi:sigma-70 family RNA polymerase sigma factor [Fulvivirga sp. 29W222]|uniref:Sigma-70 family RNA polymerase sigma factor n=1 Tax=Fulvivirga marina TaxID=2494733 RepID=A0A937G2Y1_9BACT|nr:sigma-70 family RNA polymerase sigma factor [Fulvivirga marina]MBL6449025.1 sigma-70 family RNA polymerase sigma factor [Fulvivirga marina]